MTGQAKSSTRRFRRCCGRSRGSPSRRGRHERRSAPTVPPPGRGLAAVVPALKAWVGSLGRLAQGPCRRRGGRGAGGGRQRPGRHGGLGARRREPRARALRELRGADLRRADVQHPPHGDHDHERRGAGGGLGPAELQRRGARAGAHHPHPARRRADGGRRHLPARSLHALRLALGHARLPHGRGRQHRAQSGRRLHGCGGQRRSRAHASHRHPPASRPRPGSNRCWSAARRWSCSSCSRGRASPPTPPSSPSSCRACSPWRCPPWPRSRTSARYRPASPGPPCRRCTCCSRPTS